MKYQLIQIVAIVLCVNNIVSSEEYKCKADKVFPMKDLDVAKLFNNTWRIQRCSPSVLCDNLACTDFRFIPGSATEYGIDVTAYNQSSGSNIEVIGVGIHPTPGEAYGDFEIESATTKYYFPITDYENYFVAITWLPDVIGNIRRAAWLFGKTDEPLPFVRGEIEETLKMNNVEWDDLIQRDNVNCPPIK